MSTQPIQVIKQVAELLAEAGITQYQLRQEGGLSANTARSLLGLTPGKNPSVESIEIALSLLKPPRELRAVRKGKV